MGPYLLMPKKIITSKASFQLSLICLAKVEKKNITKEMIPKRQSSLKTLSIIFLLVSSSLLSKKPKSSSMDMEKMVITIRKMETREASKLGPTSKMFGCSSTLPSSFSEPSSVWKKAKTNLVHFVPLPSSTTGSDGSYR